MSLMTVSLYSGGLYGCEVSGDYPEYDTPTHLHNIVLIAKVKSLASSKQQKVNSKYQEVRNK